MTHQNHEELRTRDFKVVSDALGLDGWTCFDSKFNVTLDSTFTSWYVEVNKKKLWAFVSNGKLTGTTLY